MNGPELLNVTSFSPLSVCFPVCLAASSPASSATVVVIVLLTSMYASLQSHKLDFKIVALNLTLVLLVPHPSSSFTSTQFFVLNLDN